MARKTCEVVHNKRGRFTVHPCGTLSSVLVPPGQSRAGATIENVEGSYTLVIRPIHSQGTGKAANGCPYCLTPYDGASAAMQARTPAGPADRAEVVI